MTSNLNVSTHRLHPVLRGQFRSWWLWPQPASPGFYGKEWSGTLWVTTNHLPSIAAKDNQPGTLVLAVEAGGLHPFLAAAFDPSVVEDAVRYEQLTLPTGINGVVVDPFLARRLSIKIDKSDAGITVRFVSSPNADRSQIIQRLIGTLILTLGQAIIFILPLLIFGSQNLIVGLCVLFTAGLALSLLWPLSRRKCLWCRFALSTLSTLIVAAIAGFALGFQPERLAWLAGGWWLSSFWLSFVFIGARH